MAIEIVDFPIKNGDFPSQTVSLPEGIVNGSFGIRFLHVILLWINVLMLQAEPATTPSLPA
jgi:hypothetical protein